MSITSMRIGSSAVGVVNSKKFALGGRFSTDFRPKVTDQPRIFCLASIWSCTAASKSEAPKSTLLYKSCSNKKNPRGFVTETFKTGITNPRGFFDLSNFYFIKLISEPLTLSLP